MAAENYNIFVCAQLKNLLSGFRYTDCTYPCIFICIARYYINITHCFAPTSAAHFYFTLLENNAEFIIQKGVLYNLLRLSAYNDISAWYGYLILEVSIPPTLLYHGFCMIYNFYIVIRTNGLKLQLYDIPLNQEV